MSSYKDAFPSKYLKAEDLGGTRPTATIESVAFEDVGVGVKKDRKLVVQFAERLFKPLVLNRINADTIADIAGTDEIETWTGVRVALYATTTEFQGKRVPCIRLDRPPVARTKPRPVAPRAAVSEPPAEREAPLEEPDEYADSIPF
jgi:hypothetical protein